MRDQRRTEGGNHTRSSCEGLTRKGSGAQTASGIKAACRRSSLQREEKDEEEVEEEEEERRGGRAEKKIKRKQLVNFTASVFILLIRPSAWRTQSLGEEREIML